MSDYYDDYYIYIRGYDIRLLACWFVLIYAASCREGS
jgi:hypothetical protein